MSSLRNYTYNLKELKLISVELHPIQFASIRHSRKKFLQVTVRRGKKQSIVCIYNVSQITRDETSSFATASCMRTVIIMMNNSGLSVQPSEMLEFCAFLSEKNPLIFNIKGAAMHHVTNHLQTEIWDTESTECIEKAVRADAVKCLLPIKCQ